MKGEHNMRTMEKLCKRFERIHAGYKAELDKLDSYRGAYWVHVYNDFIGSTYFFSSADEFKTWALGVILD